MESSTLALAGRALANPGRALAFALARVRGAWYRWSLPMLGYRFSAGRGFSVRGRLVLRGPGRVIFGANVAIIETVTPWTTNRDAVVTVGDRSELAGTRMTCASSITIGCDCIIADARIMDSDLHPLGPDRRNPGAPIRTIPVVIEDNVWLAAQSALLAGTTVGRNSIVSFGAVCSGKYPADVIVVGNPARVAGKIPVSPAEPPGAGSTARAGATT